MGLKGQLDRNLRIERAYEVSVGTNSVKQQRVDGVKCFIHHRRKGRKVNWLPTACSCYLIFVPKIEVDLIKVVDIELDHVIACCNFRCREFFCVVHIYREPTFRSLMNIQ